MSSHFPSHFQILLVPLRVLAYVSRFDMTHLPVQPSQPRITGPGLWGGRLYVWDSLASTNRRALDRLDTFRHGDVLRARAQTAGRGRLGRSWIAPPGRCLTVSLVLDPGRMGVPAPNVGQLLALAVHRTLAGLGLPAGLKWPNDLLVRGRKIAGILVESHDPEKLLVAGIGLNVNLSRPEIDALGLDRPATSMAAEAGRPFALHAVLRRLLADIRRVTGDSVRDGFPALRAEWAAADVLCGHRLEVRTPRGIMRGRCEGLEADGRLRLVDDDGLPHSLWSGEVERVRPVPA